MVDINGQIATMPDYKNGKIYKLWSVQTDLIYIGSTTQPLHKRLYNHKKLYDSHLAGKHNYVTSFELFKFDDVKIELIENCPCATKVELLRREGELIRLHDCVNKNIAGRSIKEYQEDNRDKISQRGKQYREDNRDNISEKRRERYVNNREQILEKNAQYRYDNYEKICEYQKHYNETVRYKEKTICDQCGVEFVTGRLKRHQKTKKCISAGKAQTTASA